MTFWDGSFELDESNGSLGKLFLDTALWLRIASCLEVLYSRLLQLCPVSAAAPKNQ